MRPWVPLTPLLIALTGCSASASVSVGGKSISGGQQEKKIRADYETQVAPLKLTAIDCQDAKLKVGQPIACTGKNSKGVDLTIGGRVDTVDGDHGNFSWKVTSAYAPGSLFAGNVQTSLERASGKTLGALTCPDRVQLRAGGSFACKAASGQRVIVTQKDGNGAFDARVG